MFQPLENVRPFLKMAFQGFAGDGKTFTATQVAIGLHKSIQSTKPIAILDTEAASKALVPLFKKAGIKAVVSENRSLAALNEAIKWCEQGNADILLIDSISHVWEEFVEAYKNSKKYNKTFLEFADWGVIKPRWKREFSTPFIKAKVHIIFTGRAGYTYDFTETQDGASGRVKKEIQKSGYKMKAEGETAFEPDLLVMMEKHEDLLNESKKIWRVATILKDRTNSIDGESFKNPTFETFKPAIDLLLDGVCKSLKNDGLEDVFQHENDNLENRRERDICINEIKGCFELCKLGTGKEEKGYIAAMLKSFFGVTSIESVEKMPLDKVKFGLSDIRAVADRYELYLKECDVKGIPFEIKQIALYVKEQLGDLPM
jgi:hypothetical protein